MDTFICPHCGVESSFDPWRESARCAKCGFEPPKKSNQRAYLRWLDRLPVGQGAGQGRPISINCESCGAELPKSHSFTVPWIIYGAIAYGPCPGCDTRRVRWKIQLRFPQSAAIFAAGLATGLLAFVVILVIVRSLQWTGPSVLCLGVLLPSFVTISTWHLLGRR